MKITKDSLIYDISNMAYAIADTGEDCRHALHLVRDICEEGNIDLVSRVLGLAYSNLLTVLLPLLSPPRINVNKDRSDSTHDYEFSFRKDGCFKHKLCDGIKLKIKETAREYMVCMVLADWLGVTLPEMAGVWKYRMEEAYKSLKTIVSDITVSLYSAAFRRKVPVI